MLTKVTDNRFRRYNYFVDPVQSLIKRTRLKSKHLVWSMGGVPSFNKALVLSYQKIQWFGAETETGKVYLINRKDLVDELNWAEPQLTCKDLDKWIIRQIPKQDKLV